METKNLTCIGCPMGCQISVTMNGNEILSVTGNTCAVGDKYARQEVTHPERTVTSTVIVLGGDRPRVSVKTRGSIPKSMIFECIDAINQIALTAPVSIGDTVIANVCGTDIDVVATSNVRTA